MKFKSKEDLIKENSKTKESEGIAYEHEIDTHYNDGLKDGINTAFQSISERKEFYEKYKNQMAWLKEWHKEVWKIYRKALNERSIKDTKFEMDFYNDWLFRFCFDGVK